MSAMNRLPLGVAALHLAMSAATAQTVTVTTTADAVDINWQTATVADLPGPDGLVSFSEAMIATNNTPGHQTVAFAIPASQLGWCCPQYAGVAVFHSVTAFFWRANDEVTIDGTTQTAFGGDTNPNGAEVQFFSGTIYLNQGASVFRGVHGGAVDSSGAGNLIEQNTGGIHVTLFAGGGSTVRDNICGTIKIDRSNDNVVIGNTAQRVRVLGGGSSAPAIDNRVGGPTEAERNFLTGYGTWNSEGLPAGAAVQLAWTDGTRIENNRIGTTPDGLSQGNLACTMGISFETENHNVLVQDNHIAGVLGRGMGPHHAGQLFGWAVYFWGSTTNIRLMNNVIGLNAAGAPTLGSVWGVNVDNFAGYTVDGVEITGNVIAGHRLDGVRVGPTAMMRLSENAIYANSGLGIDLIPNGFASGVSVNDLMDVDEGGNAVQNYPELMEATLSGGSLQVVGTLHSTPSSLFRVEFFGSSECDASGFGEGEVFLGAADVATDSSGDASIDVSLASTVSAGWVVTATATNAATGGTSEFSACASVAGTTLLGDVDGDGDVDFTDLNLLLGNYNGVGANLPGDCDGDGDVDFADLNILLSEYNGA